METGTLPYVKYIGSGNLLCDTWCSNPVLCDKLEGWDGVEMAIHSSIFTWKIPWTEEPGELQSMELQSQTRLHTCTHG